MRGFTEEDALAIRKGGFSEEKLDAAIKLAQSIAHNKGNPENGALENFFNAGNDEEALIELTALVGLISFINYVFANTQILIDFPLIQAI
jgi:alkylhydroperoxidase family enzyme